MIRQVSEPELLQAIYELYYWKYGSSPTSFTSMLYTLISKADLQNEARLAAAFPAECRAFELWKIARDEIAFFESWGLFSRVMP